MRKNKALFALLAGVLAAALFAVPATAQAETVDDDGVVRLTQADFNPEHEDTLYTISDSRTYVLDGDVKGRVMFTSNGNVKPTLDLNGYKLTGVGDSAILCSTGQMGTITIKNGTISQSNEKHVVYVDGGVLTVNFNDVNVSATNAICVQVESSSAVNINGGTYTTTNTNGGNGEPVLCAGGKWGRIIVTDGDFQLVGGTTIVKRDNDAATNYIQIAPASASSNITFSSFPSQAAITPGYVLLKSKGGSYEVVASDSEKVTNANWKVSGVTNYDTVYFEDGDEAKAFAAEDTATRTATQLRATVTFDANNGTDPETKTVAVNSAVEKPATDPTKDGYVFKFWSANGTDEFNFNSAITEDTTLTAVYAEAVASYNGAYYTSLKDAVAAAKNDGGTVTLLKSTSEEVKVEQSADLTIDLNGNTLSRTGRGNVPLTVTGKVNLTITGGNIESEADCLSVKESAEGSVITLEDGLSFHTSAKNEKNANAIMVNGASKVIVKGGSYESDKNEAVQLYNGATLSVLDGTFTSEGSDTIYAKYDCVVEFAGEKVSGHILLIEDSTATVYSGEFGDATNAADVVAGKYLYSADGKTYKVIDLESDEYLTDATCVVYDKTAGTKVYFKSHDDAVAYTDPLFEEGHEVAIVNLYRATFVANGTTYDLRVLEDGDKIGELPDGSDLKVEGYTFAGWYVDGKQIDAEFEVTEDVDVVAMWYKDGSETDPTDDPSGKGDETPSDDSKGKGDKKLPQTGDPALAVSAIAAAGAALAGIGALRRRK